MQDQVLNIVNMDHDHIVRSVPEAPKGSLLGFGFLILSFVIELIIFLLT